VIAMALKISQSFKYEGDDWWRWWIWLEGSETELDTVRHVVYTLHKTFPDPVRKVSERRSQFRLESRGWGTFRIYAKVVGKDGNEQKLEHDLVLEYPDGTPTAA
jgi:transcription initiation factor IIF auxiliary subunit